MRVRLIGMALLCTGAVAGCGRDEPVSIAWTFDVGARGGGPFGARMFLDGEQVYLDAAPNSSYHRAQVVRPFSPGSHVLEVEIVAQRDPAPATYVASATATTEGPSPMQRTIHADGIPWILTVGQRLRLTLDL